MALILDTGPLYALYDRSDRDHRRCRELLEATPETLVIPAPVLPEFGFLASSRVGPLLSPTLLEDISSGAFQVADLLPNDYLRCRDLMHQYADSDIGFVDAAVLAIVERLREPKLATLDRRHFGILRPRHVESLEILPA